MCATELQWWPSSASSSAVAGDVLDARRIAVVAIARQGPRRRRGGLAVVCLDAVGSTLASSAAVALAVVLAVASGLDVAALAGSIADRR